MFIIRLILILLFPTDEPVEQGKDVEQDKAKEGQEADQADSKEKLKEKESSNRAALAKQKERVSALDNFSS